MTRAFYSINLFGQPYRKDANIGDTLKSVRANLNANGIRIYNDTLDSLGVFSVDAAQQSQAERVLKNGAFYYSYKGTRNEPDSVSSSTSKPTSSGGSSGTNTVNTVSPNPSVNSPSATAGPSTGYTADDWIRYPVKAGETGSVIAKKYKRLPEEYVKIMKPNGQYLSPYTSSSLKEGEIVLIPGSWQKVSSGDDELLFWGAIGWTAWKVFA